MTPTSAGGGDTFVVAQTTKGPIWSDDSGGTWTRGTGTAYSSLSLAGGGVAYNGSLWVCVALNSSAGSSTSMLHYSTDGKAWTASSVFIQEQMYAVAWNGSYWLATGNNDVQGTGNTATASILKSTDGVNWLPVDQGYSNKIMAAGVKGIAWNGSQWIAVGNGSQAGQTDIAYSSNGTSWGYATGASWNTQGYNAAWNGSVWVASGDAGVTLCYSANGTSWTGSSNTSDYTQVEALAWNGTVFLAAGLGYGASGNWGGTSTNGQSWTNSPNPPLGVNYGVAWDGFQWYAGGRIGRQGSFVIYTSPDGTTWTGSLPDVPGAGSISGVDRVFGIATSIAPNLYPAIT